MDPEKSVLRISALQLAALSLHLLRNGPCNDGFYRDGMKTPHSLNISSCLNRGDTGVCYGKGEAGRVMAASTV